MSVREPSWKLVDMLNQSHKASLQSKINFKKSSYLLPERDDLRHKAIEAAKRGERKTEVSRILHISRSTLDLWLKRQAETGDYRAITHYQQGCRH